MNDIAQAKAQVRLQNWQMMYSEYANSGMTVKDWCENNNLSTKTFYYRLKRLRMETLNREHHDIVAIGNTGDNIVSTSNCICRPENRSCTESEPHPCRLRTRSSIMLVAHGSVTINIRRS